MVPEADPPPDDCAGPDQFSDRFTEVELLDWGGIACVYSALDTQRREFVAIKRLRSSATEASARRFSEEIRISDKKLVDDTIVPFYEAFPSEVPPFFTMKRMTGGNLAKKLKRSPLTPAEILPILERIAEAVDYAHRQGITHRDIKPANILFDEKARAYLSDFSIALAEERPAHPEATPHHDPLPDVAGTWRYASPEQLAGGKVGQTTDIYSLGIVLFEMLTGKPLFEGDDRAEQLLQRTNMKRLEKRIAGHAEARRFAPVLLRAMADLPDTRYKKARDLFEGFRQVMNRRFGLPGWWPLAAGVAGLAGVALILVAGALIIQGIREPTVTPTATEQSVAGLATETAAASATGAGTAAPTGEGVTAEPTLAPPPTADPDGASPPATETVTPSLTPTAAIPTPSPTAALAGPRLETTGRANVRTGPGLLYDVLTVLVRGVEAAVLGRATTDDGDWYNIELGDGRRGWISDMVVLLTGAEPGEVPVAATIPAPPAPTPGAPPAPPTATPASGEPPPPPASTAAATPTDTPIPLEATATDTPIP